MIGLIGKLNAHRALAQVMADNHALWECAADRFQQAQPFGTIQALGLSLQALIEGDRLNAHVRARRFPRLLRGVGRALAAFHSAPLPLERTRDPQREVASLTNRSRLLRAVTADPGRVDRLVGRLTDAVAAHCRMTGPVHGDFHHANVMVNDDGIALIDFDEMGLGDPALDAGRFAVSLSVPSLREFGDLRLLDLGREHFLRPYLEKTGIDPRRVRIFEAAGFLISALTLWRLNRAEGGAPVDNLIGLAESALDEALRRPPSRRTDTGPRAPGSVDRRRWAADSDYVGQLMKPAVHRLHGAEIHRTEVRLGSPGGSSLSLACEMWGATAADRWHGRAEGVCRRNLGASATARLADRLREILAEDPDAILIPPILGINQRLGLILWERMETRKLPTSTAPETPGGSACLGRALARLHAADREPEGRSTLADFLGRQGLPAANELGLDPVEPLAPSLSAPRIPHFGLAEDRIVIRRPDKLGLYPPLLAVAQIERDLAARAGAAAAAAFRDAYLAANGRDASAVDAFARLLPLHGPRKP